MSGASENPVVAAARAYAAAKREKAQADANKDAAVATLAECVTRLRDAKVALKAAVDAELA